MRIIHSILIALITSTFLSACMVTVDDYPPQNPNPILTEKHTVGSFSSIKVQSEFPVNIQMGNEYAIYLTSDENSLYDFSIRNLNGTLEIKDPYSGYISNSTQWVIVVPDLHKIIANGNGIITLPKDQDFPDLFLQQNGAGEIRFQGTAGKLLAEVNGSGNIYLEGYCDFFQGDVNYSGHVLADNLYTQDADLQLSGSGNILLGLDHQAHLKLDLSGSGHLEWWGDPALVKYSLTGTGKVIEHREVLFKKLAKRNVLASTVLTKP